MVSLWCAHNGPSKEFISPFEYSRWDISPTIMQPHTPFTRDSAFTQSYFSSHPTSCKLTHCLPETVPSFNHISHHTQRHATSHTVYQRQCFHSIIFLAFLIIWLTRKVGVNKNILCFSLRNIWEFSVLLLKSNLWQTFFVNNNDRTLRF